MPKYPRLQSLKEINSVMARYYVQRKALARLKPLAYVTSGLSRASASARWKYAFHDCGFCLSCTVVSYSAASASLASRSNSIRKSRDRRRAHGDALRFPVPGGGRLGMQRRRGEKQRSHSDNRESESEHVVHPFLGGEADRRLPAWAATIPRPCRPRKGFPTDRAPRRRHLRRPRASEPQAPRPRGEPGIAPAALGPAVIAGNKHDLHLCLE